jgi:hypothetical protein
VDLSGISKSRAQRKTASNDHPRSEGETFGIINGSSVVKAQFICPKEPDDGSARIDGLLYEKGLSPLDSRGGVAEHLMLYGQQQMKTEEKTIG